MGISSERTQDDRPKRMTAAQASAKYGYSGKLGSNKGMTNRPKFKAKKSSYK